MRVISINANGIRAAARKGLFEWLAEQQADVICIQETKAKQVQLSDAIFHPTAYERYFYDAEKPGYSGTAIYSRHPVKNVHYGLGWEHADNEGRYLQIDFAKLSIASIYLPSGSSGDIRQAVKFDFMEKYQHILQNLNRKKRQYILCGDWNIVHKAIDIKNFKSNQKHSGCLPEERAWLDTLFDQYGLVDAFRVVDQRAEQYTWWSNRGQAWAKNVGWRIDYQITTKGLLNAIQAASIYKAQRFSDHAPLIIDYNDAMIKPLL